MAPYSPEVEDIIRKPLHPIALRGTLVLGGVVAALIVVTFLVTYPVRLRTNFEVTTADPPRVLSFIEPTRLEQLLVSQGDTVVAGQTLAVATGHQARFEHVLYLEDLLLQASTDGTDAVAQLAIPADLELGKLREPVANFVGVRERRNQTATAAAFQTLEQSVANWKARFTLVSPAEGTAQVVDQPLGTTIRPATPVVTVIPLDGGRLIGRATLPLTDSRAVVSGQEVVVSLHKYPAIDYGSVVGRVSRVRADAANDELEVSIVFPRGLVTTMGFRVPVDLDLTGEAVITVGKQRLLSRLFFPRDRPGAR